MPALELSRDGQSQAIQEVRFTGLATVTEAQLWPILTRARPASLTLSQAQALVQRVQQTGLFSEVKPTLQLVPGATPHAVLEIAVTEFPTLRTVELRGLTEYRGSELLELLLQTPEQPTWRDEDRCPDPVPPRSLLAHVDNGLLSPGIVWRGLAPGLNRLVHRLRDDGYVLATASAVLTPQGALGVDLDEGRLEKIVIEGVPAELEPKIRKQLGLEQGQVFVADELERALERVESRFPYLSAEVRPTSELAGDVHVEERSGPDGQRVYTTAAGAATDVGMEVELRFGPHHGHVSIHEKRADASRPKHHDLQLPWGHHGEATVHDKSVVVEFESSRTSLRNDWSELFKHTQVTNFAPGVMLSGWLWDPADRVHLGLDAGINLNTGRHDHLVDWAIGPRFQVPSIKLAEVGVQFHSIIDTEDRWRVSRLDSYLHSVLVRRPESEYFLRTGGWAFATFQLFDKLILGGEYRRDVYQSLEPLPHVWSLFHGHDATYPNPAITDGEMGSVLLRVEYSTQKTQLHDVGDPWRAVTRSIVDRAFYGELRTGFTTVNTVEISNSALGSDAGLEFIKFVSDSSLHLATGKNRGLRVRLRAAGGDHLPLQKQEALGGWGSLRGYDFKEFRGDYSVLTSVEYQWFVFSLFADLGTVHQPEGWIVPRLGVGGSLKLSDWVSLAAAWRTDDQARWAPEMRLTIGRSF